MLKDLVGGTSEGLNIRSGDDGTYVDGLMVESVASPSDVVEVTNKALLRRCTKSTKMNDTSSRSHVLLSMRFVATRSVEEAQAVGSKVVRKAGVLHLCDLAGSERVKKSQAGVDDPALMREAVAINKSLRWLTPCTANRSSFIAHHAPFITPCSYSFTIQYSSLMRVMRGERMNHEGCKMRDERPVLNEE